MDLFSKPQAPDTDPWWPTSVMGRKSGGRILGTDNSVWLFAKVPLSPVTDARSPAEALAAGEPLRLALEEIASTTHVRVNRRSVSKANYRDVHMLLVNVPDDFKPPPGSPIAGAFPDAEVLRRVLLLGVRLKSRYGDGGLRSAVDSVVETWTVGGTPIEDFDRDFENMSAIMARSGLQTMTDTDFALANGYWNKGKSPDTPMLVHDDHLHIFSSTSSMHAAARLKARDGDDECASWQIPNHHTLTFGTVRSFDFGYPDATSSAAQWASALINAGAVCVSVRGRLEPATVTRSELRKGKKKYLDDINERLQQNKMARAEQEEMLAELDELERYYATGGPATLMDASTLVVISGQVGMHGYDMSEFATNSRLELSTMTSRQNQALAETWLASPMRANPYLHDLPTITLGAAGLSGLSMVGDLSGATLGFTEHDRQHAMISPTAAADEDSIPMVLVAGATGSGKATRLSTRVPTPTGWTTMGELRVGDQVLGRDGLPCAVTSLSEINNAPDLYRVTFDDGQEVYADFDHQWVVSSFLTRHRGKSPKRVNAIANWDAAQITAGQIKELAAIFGPDDTLTVPEMMEIGEKYVTHWPYTYGEAVRSSLAFLDCPSSLAERTSHVTYSQTQHTKIDPVMLYPVAETLRANVAAWKSIRSGNAVRWGARAKVKVGAAKALLATVGQKDEATTPDIVRSLNQHGADFLMSSHGQLGRAARRAGVTRRKGTSVVKVPLPSETTMTREYTVYPAQIAFKSLGARLTQRYANRPTSEVEEVVMTTGEMLAEYQRTSTLGRSQRYAVRTTQPIEMSLVELPFDPYALGAWLGDGGRHNLEITSADPEIIEEIVASGYEIRRVVSPTSSGAALLYYFDGFRDGLAAAGFDAKAEKVREKFIPSMYLRASVEQRLALLQGLMDTDGTIDKLGSCELCLCDETLINDALELIRSLGIKASLSSGPAVITEKDPDNPGTKRRRVTGTRWRIHFTTTVPVFRLSRKAERLPTKTRDTAGNLYITSIESVETEPARCIQVDSSDSTYLVEGFIPTHNSMLMLYLADQFSKIVTANGERTPTIIVDPKQSSSHDAAVLAAGGRIASLDDLIAADGVFDPLRFSKTRGSGVELAASMLMSINPWGSDASDYEMPITRAIAYGVDQGGDCIGVALQTALKDGIADKQMVAKVLDLAESSAMFRACIGSVNGGQSLRASEGITYIKVGDAHLDIPAPGTPSHEVNLNQRVALALVRMMVFGSASALSMRSGVLMLDEAWVMLSAGRSEMERLGRLARSQQVLPMMFTQRVTDALNSGLAGYISRGIILPIQDEDEAMAACEVFKLEATPERMERITARATMGMAGAEDGVAPNWNSMRALRDPKTNRVLRGAVGIYIDLAGRAVPVEIQLPEEFLRLASTNPEDIRRRQAALATGVR